MALDNYVLLSPDAINLDEQNRDALKRVVNDDPLALIEYWAVDPDYDGELFRSVWQDYRGNTENDNDPLTRRDGSNVFALTRRRPEPPRLRPCGRRLRLRVRGRCGRSRNRHHDGYPDVFPLAAGLGRIVDPQIPELVAGEPAEVLEQVTPVTANLLAILVRGRLLRPRELNFHEGQRQAILNIIFAHEVLAPEGFRICTRRSPRRSARRRDSGRGNARPSQPSECTPRRWRPAPARRGC